MNYKPSNISKQSSQDSTHHSQNKDSHDTSTLSYTRFQNLSSTERGELLLAKGLIDDNDLKILTSSANLPELIADQFIENCIGTYSLPLGLATNFLIDGEEFLIPMAIEESSVLAAASYGAKLTRSVNGFTTEKTETVATCQIQFSQTDKTFADDFENKYKQHIFDHANQLTPRLLERGGGVRSVELRKLSKPHYYVIHIHVDTCEAMGANIVNSIAEEIGEFLPKIFTCHVGTKILTNLTLQRITKAKCEVEFTALQKSGYTGKEAAERIHDVWEFAALDPFRAATHNKGIMNGIDAVVIATGNDWRAVEAGCHAFASLGGYKPLSRWFINDKNRLQGEIEVPVAVGTVGGVTRLHPAAHLAMKILKNPSAAKLSGIIASVGLAQNLSAIRALACEGIQKGHMALHQKNLEMMKNSETVVVSHLQNSKIKN